MKNTMPHSSSSCFVCLGLHEEEEAAERKQHGSDVLYAVILLVCLFDLIL